jgi:hypothetical protein
VLWETNAFVPTGRQEELAVAASGGDLYMLGQLLGLHPLATVVGGVGVAAGLAATLLGLTALRERWGAYVVGGTAAVFLVLVVPPFFTAAAELVSLPQARRLVLVAPLPFALAGACLVLARALPARVGSPAVRTVAAAVVVAAPFLALGLAGVERDRPDPRALPPGLVSVLREQVPPRAVVFADLETSYRVSAAAPLLVAALPPRYVGRTASNDAYGRRSDVIRFFWQEGPSYLDRAGLLARRGATWLLVDRRRRPPAYVELLRPPVYDDGTYALYHLRDSRQ